MNRIQEATRLLKAEYNELDPAIWEDNEKSLSLGFIIRKLEELK